MTYEAYQRERTRLCEVLRDARERGDRYLEFDVIELLEKLEEQHIDE